MWISFVAAQDPNKHGIPGLPIWPTYTPQSKRVLQLDSAANYTTKKDDDRAAGIAYFHSLQGYVTGR